MSIPPNAFLVTHRPGNRLTQRNPDILNRMVGVNVQVTLRLDFQINQPMPGHLVEHVVEKWHTSGQICPADSVKIEGNPNLGFIGVTLDGCLAHIPENPV